MPQNARTAIVTGGSGGIGAEIVRRLADDGFEVVNFDVVAPDASAAHHEHVDLTSAEAISNAVALVAEQVGPPSVLVHAAAHQVIAPMLELSASDWDTTLAVNVTAAFHLARAVTPHLIAEGNGRIIVLTSSTYFAPPPNMVHYITSKGALTGMVRALATELGPHGATVNAVAPGLTRTSKAERDVPPEHFAAVQAQQAIPRSGRPADIAGAVRFLASADASFITGQTLLVDGGASFV